MLEKLWDLLNIFLNIFYPILNNAIIMFFIVLVIIAIWEEDIRKGKKEAIFRMKTISVLKYLLVTKIFLLIILGKEIIKEANILENSIFGTLTLILILSLYYKVDKKIENF